MKRIMITILLDHDLDHIHLPLLKKALQTPTPRGFRRSEWAMTLGTARRIMDKIQREVNAHGVRVEVEAYDVSLLSHVLAHAAKRLRAGEARKAFVASMAYFKGLVEADPDYKVLQARNRAEEEAAERVANLKARLTAAEDVLRQVQQKNRESETD